MGDTRDIMEERKIRVLVGKPGLDGHDRGAKLSQVKVGKAFIFTPLRAVISLDKLLYIKADIFYNRDKSQALSKRSLIPSSSTRYYI